MVPMHQFITNYELHDPGKKFEFCGNLTCRSHTGDDDELPNQRFWQSADPQLLNRGFWPSERVFGKTRNGNIYTYVMVAKAKLEIATFVQNEAMKES